ncbi:hypothetical protein C8R44DRAFT_786936, partial [Mycena epipterygia]
MTGTITGAVIVVVFGSSILQRRNLRRALWLTLRGRSILAAIFSTLPLLAIADRHGRTEMALLLGGPVGAIIYPRLLAPLSFSL